LQDASLRRLAGTPNTLILIKEFKFGHCKWRKIPYHISVQNNFCQWLEFAQLFIKQAAEQETTETRKGTDLSIYKLYGEDGNIVTTKLPSGELAISSPPVGPLEQLVYALCNRRGYRISQSPYRWIVKPEHVVAATIEFQRKCITVSG